MKARNKRNKIYLFTVILALLIFGINSLLDSGDSLTSNYGNTVVHFIDVDQGDAIYIKTPSQNILIDAGERGNIVVDYLTKLNVTSLDLVIGTHPHDDHIGGLINVFQHIKVKEVIDPGIVHTSRTFEDYLTLIDEKGIKFTEGRAGMKRKLDDNTLLEILHPTTPNSGDLNGSSIVTKLTFGDMSFLFTGDADTSSEKEILSLGYDVRSTILKVGHHGSSASTSDDFLDAVSPEAVIIMCGTDNSYGHPHKETMEKLNDSDIAIYRTDIDGNIVVSTDGQTYEVTHD